MKKAKFDADYYHRFYEDKQSRAVSPEEQRRQSSFIAAYLHYLEIEINTFADLGCGVGTMLEQLQTEFPHARSQGIEYSTYLCDRFGWQQGSVVDYRLHNADTPFDLVICNDVLGYLTKKQCQQAISNLARLTQSALYLSVLTTEDADICDETLTDMSQHIRPIQWYRQLLDKHFVSVGGGLFLRKPLSHPVWQIERC